MAQVADVASENESKNAMLKQEDIAFRRMSIKAGEHETNIIPSTELSVFSTDFEFDEMG